MAYKPVHEDLREVSKDIQEKAHSYIGTTGHWVADYAAERLEAMADALEAKHNAGIAAVRKEMQEAKVETCSTCRFYSTYTGREFGLCRRHPPIVLITNERMEAQPYASGSDWCGEFQLQQNGG